MGKYERRTGGTRCLPGRLSGACLRLPVLLIHIVFVPTYILRRLRRVFNNEIKGGHGKMESGSVLVWYGRAHGVLVSCGVGCVG